MLGETDRFQCGNFQLAARTAADQRPVSSWLWVATLVVLLASLNLRASVVKFAYDDAGRLIKADYGNGIAVTYLYDNAGNLLSRRVGVSTVGLYFPFYQSDASSLTAFAVSNFSDKSATLDFTLFGNDGRLPALANNPTTLQLPAQNQLARIGIELFGVSPSASQSGWVQLTSDNSEIASFFQYLGPSQLDGSVPFTRQFKKFYFTRVFEGTSAFFGQPAITFLSIANPNDQPITLRLTLNGGQPNPPLVAPQTETVPGKGALYKTVSEIFRQSLSVSSGFIQVEVTDGEGAVGFELIRLTSGNSVIGLNATPGNDFNQSFSAQFASAPSVLFTSLKLINVGSELRSVTLAATGEDGNNLAEPRKIELAGGQFLEQDATQVLELPSGTPLVGSLRVGADGPGIVGDVIFGDPSAFAYAASMPLQAQAARKLVFSQVANVLGFFTGLALYNPNPTSADITVDVYSASGMRAGRETFPLDAGKRLSKTLAELVPASASLAGGFVVVQSTQPLIAQQLFGDSGFTFLSAVPPTIVP